MDKKMNPFISYSFAVAVFLFVLSAFFPDVISPYLKYINLKPEEFSTIMLVLFAIIVFGSFFDAFKIDINKKFLPEKLSDGNLNDFILKKFLALCIFSEPHPRFRQPDGMEPYLTLSTVIFYENYFVVSCFGFYKKFDYDKTKIKIEKYKFLKYCKVKFGENKMLFLISKSSEKILEHYILS